MDVKARDFVPAAQAALSDPALRAAVKRATDTAAKKRLVTMFWAGRAHGEALRQQAAQARRRALRDLPALLEQAEAAMTANGIQVLWAADGDEVRRLVLDIAARHDVRRAVKSKSMVSEEVALNHALQAHDIDVLETDLGEFIVQLSDETPSHIVTPVIHKSKETIRDLFVRELDMPPTDDAEAMTQFARGHLRRAFLEADMGISGGNFIIAETGALCLVTNEGNGRMVTALPRVHVALVGIEKVIATVEDYATLTQILPRSSTGQTMTVYTQMIHGPRGADDDGPEHVYVILVDNGRSDIYATGYAEALACIRCGACLNACPVYEATGGHAYGWVYSGPIGAVITPLLTGLENASPLPHASSLCGLCKEVCPVDIDLPRMLLDLRHDLDETGHTPPVWKGGMRGFGIVAGSPRLFELAERAAGLGGRFLPPRPPLPPPLNGWTNVRDLPAIPPKSFRRLWAERQKAKKTP